MDDIDIYQEIVALQQSRKPAALATVVESSGSAPRKAGAKMLVFSDGSTRGTIGGGQAELETIEAALVAIATGTGRTLSFVLTEEYGHVCGGRVLIFVEPVMVAPQLLIIGAGHVGKALASAAGFAGFRVLVADQRSAFIECMQQMPGVQEAIVGDADAAFRHFGVNDNSFVVIATTGFEQDFDAVRAALRTPARYIGVIGSSRKREVLEQTLIEEGLGADVARLTIPVGLPIGAQAPEEIAISIVGQLIQVRRTHAAARVGDSPGSREIASNGMLQATIATG